MLRDTRNSTHEGRFLNLIRIEKRWRPALALILWTGVSAGAHSGDRAYPIPYLSDEVLEEDWVDTHEETQYYEAIARTASGPTLDSPGVRYFK